MWQNWLFSSVKGYDGIEFAKMNVTPPLLPKIKDKEFTQGALGFSHISRGKNINLCFSILCISLKIKMNRDVVWTSNATSMAQGKDLSLYKITKFGVKVEHFIHEKKLWSNIQLRSQKKKSFVQNQLCKQSVNTTNRHTYHHKFALRWKRQLQN